MRFIIFAPPYRKNSGGVRALHRLGWELQQRGHEVALLVYGGVGDPEHPVTMLKRVVPTTLGRDVIAIYPETAAQNFLATEKRVYWALAPVDDDWLRGHLDGMICSWGSKWGNGHTLYVPIIDQGFFNLEGVGERAGVVTYKAEGGDMQITDTTPETWGELSGWFKRAEYFRCGDPNSAMTIEAGLCGCPTLLTDGRDPKTEYVGDGLGLAFSEEELSRARAEMGEEYTRAYAEYAQRGIDSLEAFIKRCRTFWK